MARVCAVFHYLIKLCQQIETIGINMVHAVNIVHQATHKKRLRSIKQLTKVIDVCHNTERAPTRFKRSPVTRVMKEMNIQ